MLRSSTPDPIVRLRLESTSDRISGLEKEVGPQDGMGAAVGLVSESVNYKFLEESSCPEGRR